MAKIKVDQDSKTDDKEIFKKVQDSNKKIQEHIRELEKKYGQDHDNAIDEFSEELEENDDGW